MPQGAYTPIFEIWKGGENYTVNFNNRTVQIQVDLVSGGGAGDTCQITVDDRDWLISTPQVGDGLEVYLGYKEVGLARMGVFQTDRVTFTGPPKGITIHGTGASFAGSIKSHVVKNFDGKSLGDIVKGLLEDTCYSANIDESLSSLKIPYLNVNQSPIAALENLSRQYGGIFKVNDKQVTIGKRDGNTTASGEAMSTYVLNPSHFAEWSVEHLNRHQYDKVTATYKDPDWNTTKFESADTSSSGFLTANGESAGGDKVFNIRGWFQNKELAQAAAKAKMAELDDMLGQGQFRLAQGDPWIRDSQRLILTGFRTGIDGSYTTDVVRHTFTKDGGLSTSIVTKPPNSGDTASTSDIQGAVTVPDGSVVGTTLPTTMPSSLPNGTPAAQGQYGPGA
jgi:phage protein D